MVLTCAALGSVGEEAMGSSQAMGHYDYRARHVSVTASFLLSLAPPSSAPVTA